MLSTCSTHKKQLSQHSLNKHIRHFYTKTTTVLFVFGIQWGSEKLMSTETEISFYRNSIHFIVIIYQSKVHPFISISNCSHYRQIMDFVMMQHLS